jgi:hypothetical protein
MTKNRRDFIRHEKARLQVKRVEWKREHPEDAAQKAFLSAVENERAAGVRAGRALHRADKLAIKRIAREKRRAAEAAAKQAHRDAVADLRMNIRNTRKNLEGLKANQRRGFLSRLKAKWLGSAKAGA